MILSFVYYNSLATRVFKDQSIFFCTYHKRDNSSKFRSIDSNYNTVQVVELPVFCFGFNNKIDTNL